MAELRPTNAEFVILTPEGYTMRGRCDHIAIVGGHAGVPTVLELMGVSDFTQALTDPDDIFEVRERPLGTQDPIESMAPARPETEWVERLMKRTEEGQQLKGEEDNG